MLRTVAVDMHLRMANSCRQVCGLDKRDAGHHGEVLKRRSESRTLDRSCAQPFDRCHPCREDALSGPLTDIADFWDSDYDENAVPVCFWQCVQWHTQTNTGVNHFNSV